VPKIVVMDKILTKLLQKNKTVQFLSHMVVGARPVWCGQAFAYQCSNVLHNL